MLQKTGQAPTPLPSPLRPHEPPEAIVRQNRTDTFIYFSQGDPVIPSAFINKVLLPMEALTIKV